MEGSGFWWSTGSMGMIGFSPNSPRGPQGGRGVGSRWFFSKERGRLCQDVFPKEKAWSGTAADGGDCRWQQDSVEKGDPFYKKSEKENTHAQDSLEKGELYPCNEI
eukprot:990143-Amphidinium_carterae.1